MTNNDIREYLWQLLNDMGESDHTFEQMHLIIAEVVAKLKKANQSKLLAMRFDELHRQYKKYTHSSDNAKLMISQPQIADMYKTDFVVILGAGIDYFDGLEN